MPRRPRVLLPGAPLHIVQRGHNRQQCFFNDSDRLRYLGLLGKHANETKCAIHAYVLMTNHVHILASFDDVSIAPKLVQCLAQQYSQYLNKRLGRTGSTWEGRYWSHPVCTEKYFLTCQRYIEHNPVRTPLASRPDDYVWSSFRGNAGIAPDSLLSPHELYLALGNNDEARQQTYRNLCGCDLTPEELEKFREFMKHSATETSNVRPRGRPRKQQE